MIQLAQLYDSLQHARIGEVILVEDVIHSLLRHIIERFLHEGRKAELELHQVAHQHHQVLREGLELYQIYIDILQFLAILTDALDRKSVV